MNEQRIALPTTLGRSNSFGLAGMLSAIGGLGLGAYNSWQVSKMKRYAEKMGPVIAPNPGVGKGFTEGCGNSSKKVDAI